MTVFGGESNCHLKMARLASTEDLGFLLLELAQQVWAEWVAHDECPDHFQFNELEIPSDEQAALPMILDEIQRYVDWSSSSRDGLSVHIRCAAVIGAEDSDFFESICLFLFSKSEMPYILMRHTCLEQGACMLSDHVIAYRENDKATVERTTNFFDREFISNDLEAAIS